MLLDKSQRIFKFLSESTANTERQKKDLDYVDFLESKHLRAVVQLGRTLVLHTRCYGFKSHQLQLKWLVMIAHYLRNI